jgi:gag-polypeptide of LTR copia-type
MIEKILKSLTNTFENVVCAIKESKELSELSVDELVSSLIAHEQRKKLKKKFFSKRLCKPRWFSRRIAKYSHSKSILV